MTIFNVYDHMVSKLKTIYEDSPNTLALLKMLSVPIQDRVNVAAYLRGQIDIDTKEGVMLEQVGSKIGVKKPLAQVAESNLFTLYDDFEADEDWNDSTGFGEEGEDELGGFFVDEDGLDVGDNSTMSDTDYRVLLKQKAALFRSIMNDENLYAYMLVFGAPSVITEGVLTVDVVPNNDGDLRQWERWYIENKGFKPAGIKLNIEHVTGELSL